jgi:hypothetical protein
VSGTAERCKAGSQVWSAQRDTPGSRFKIPGTPAGVPGMTVVVVQGCRSLCSLNPWLISVHRSAVPL